MPNIIAIDSVENKDTVTKLKELIHGETHQAGEIIYRRVDDTNIELGYSDNWRDYKFDDKVVVGKIVVEKEISANDIDIVLTGAIETSLTDWFYLVTDGEMWDERPEGIPFSTWATRLILSGKEITVEDKYDEVKYTLTLEKLLNGIKLNTIHRDFDRDIENGDAITYDCIVQFAVFGEVVY